MTQLRAGAAETVITPPHGIDLTGYGNRPSAAVGKHDELYARALAIFERLGAERDVADTHAARRLLTLVGTGKSASAQIYNLYVDPRMH